MKTNVNMIRKMGDFQVIQRTKDGYFNATELLKQWNKTLGMKKEIHDFLKNKQTEEFIKVLQDEELQNTGNSPYLSTRGKHGGTWMHPVLFVKFAMWINPRFEYFVITFVFDQLIEFRHAAGDNYNILASTVQKLGHDLDYPTIAKALNWIVFNKHERGIRQKATPIQLKEMSDLQKKLAFAIDMGYIKTISDFMNELRRIYLLKWKHFSHAISA